MKAIFKSSLIVCIGLISCQKPKKVETPISNANPSSITSANEAAKPSIVKLLKADKDFIQLAESQKDFPMITDSIWNFYFALSISEKTPSDNIYKGHWLDLKSNGQYSKGIFDHTTDEGYFYYNVGKKTVELRSSQRDSSSEWTVKVDPDAMLLIGTERFNNNPWQIKLLRRSGYPKEGVPLKSEPVKNK